MRPIDADALTKIIVNERNRIQDTYGVNDEYVRCLNKYTLSMIESAPTIDAIPVKWLCSQLKNNPNDIESAYDDICINELIDRWHKRNRRRDSG